MNRNAPERAVQELEADVAVGSGVGSVAVAKVAGDLVRTRPLPTGAPVGEGSVINGVGFVELSLALAWQKEMVPGTDLVVGRVQKEYGIVAKQGGQGE